MSNLQTRLETLTRRIQAIVTTTAGPDAPITEREAFAQVVEEMELAGFGAPILDGEWTVEHRGELLRQSYN